VVIKPQIIIVDDEKNLARNLRDIMSEEGYPVDLAHDGKTGINMCQEKTFDLALIDIKLPDMTGNDVAKKIVELSPDTECILITGYASLESAVDAVNLNGVIAYEIKPLDMDRMMTLIREMGRRRQLEEERRRLEVRLEQTRRMETIGTLAGGIAHEFNNLLMGIEGNAYLIREQVDPNHPYYHELYNIEENVKKGAELTRQLLGFAGVGKYDVRPTDLNKLVKKNFQMFCRTKRGLKVYAEYQEDISAVDVDRGQINQVFLNLFTNAFQAMPAGGDLYIETRNVTLNDEYVKPFDAEPGDYVFISITDTGAGIEDALQQRIFDPFFTTRGIGRGIGLGLASVYGIIKNHRGFIDFYSKKGEGTTFNIYLPASDKEEFTEGRRQSGEILRGAETILIVDDEEMIIEIYTEALKSMGYQVLSASSGEKAIKVYKENKDRIDMVILDMIMPDVGGGEVFDTMKKINSDVKALLSSGYSIDGQAGEILERGCNAFLQKPFSMKELSRKIREVLDN